MPRDFQIGGESLVSVKGNPLVNIGSLSELGLSLDPISVSFEFFKDPLIVNAWGKAPVDMQTMNAIAHIRMELVHYDPSILDACVRSTLGGATNVNVGTVERAGKRLGAGDQLFSGNNFYVSLNIASPQGGIPWRFPFSYLEENPYTLTLGTNRSTVVLNWTAITYTFDPWGEGTGAEGYVLYSNTLDS